MKHINPSKTWGKALWTFIHSICVIDKETPEENIKESKETIRILKNIKNIIPCIRCKREWKKSLITLNELNLNEPLVLFHWSWKIHNKINKKLNKPLITYEEALKIHTKY